MQSKFLCHRFLVLSIFILMLILSFSKLVFVWGEWYSFFCILFAQAWFGRAFLSYLSGKVIVLAGGAIVYENDSLTSRFFAGAAGFLIYALMFFFEV